ncbi:hypothetical protein PENTCL1PPCAC_6712 [Pristionchus entomophagus]|uniref:Uncharacterized protein n=1 Tax=Pristionchus entomophagus TaxID=358040 RepID=A0AAV5SME0_9BILA|nr:hypothetical protein PENTCL1PPCAC_6712 [Pristionchus entomophagus]
MMMGDILDHIQMNSMREIFYSDYEGDILLTKLVRLSMRSRILLEYGKLRRDMIEGTMSESLMTLR